MSFSPLLLFQSLIFFFISLALSHCTDPEKALQEPATVENLDMEPPATDADLAKSKSSLSKDLDTNPASSATEGHSDANELKNESFGFEKGIDPQKAYVVTASHLHVRSGPDTQHSVTKKLRRGKVVYPLQFQDGWAQIAHHEWVSKKYLQPK